MTTTKELIRGLDEVLPSEWTAYLLNTGGGCNLIAIEHRDTDYTNDAPSIPFAYINESDADFYHVIHFDYDLESKVGQHFTIGFYVDDWCEPVETTDCTGLEMLAGQMLRYVTAAGQKS